MEKELKQTDISLITIWRKLLKNKLLILITTLVVFLGGMTTIIIINNRNITVSMEFNYHFRGYEDNQFPDGTIFDFKTFHNQEFLLAVKERKEEFKDLNINNLYYHKQLKFDEVVVTKREKDEDVIVSTHLLLQVPLREFSNLSTAQLFLSEVHNEILKIVKEKNSSLNVNNFFGPDFERFDDNYTYSEILSFIENGHYLLNNALQSNTDEPNVNLDTLKTNYSLWYNNNVSIGQLELEIVNNNYIRNKNKTFEIASARLHELTRKISLNQNKIDALKQMALDLGLPGNIQSDVFYKQIEQLIIENVEYDFEKNDLESYLLNLENNIDPEFEERLRIIAVTLGQFVDDYNTLQQEYLESNTKLSIISGDSIRVNKPFGLLLVAALLLAGGLTLGGTIALVIERKPTNVA